MRLFSHSVRMTVGAVAMTAGLWAPALAQDVTPTKVAVADDVPGDAKTQETPERFITDLVGELKILALAKEAGDAVSLQDVFSRALAIKKMERQLLSRSSRKGATPEQFSKYRSLFPTYIAAVYADSIDQLVSRRIEVKEVYERRPGDFIVRSSLFDTAGRERARIDWRVLKEDNALALVDVLVEGQSVNIDRRAQFTSIVSRGGFSNLITHMEEFLGA